MTRFIAIIALLLSGAAKPTQVSDHADVILEVNHWNPWGGNECHDCHGYFWRVGNRGVWEVEWQRIKLHGMATKDVREGVRVASRCRVVGQWMDSKRTVLLPQRVEVIERRADQ